MRSSLEARIVKLEDRRRPILRPLPKAERDARMREVLADPAQVLAIRERLLGPGNEPFARNGLGAMMAGLRADR